MQFNNMSESMASAVVAVYPTPSHLLSVIACTHTNTQHSHTHLNGVIMLVLHVASLQAYSSHDEQSAALLLQDITVHTQCHYTAYDALSISSSLLLTVQVRRGVGSLASTRRLGPVQSRRVHCLLTSTDRHVTLT